ncbi:hypothetical protein [Terriglobus saanensis]|uniref:Uncharacterized protein n=1 Tax=Terriglobus saanensis (strain ATCC BAA-1853 / DSM 23119 / SP1PR4) TaxID=401053 RepID=E8V214_TERSS|nr:hypothetical protein [Terriglobus saanensis]ADV84571.1 hypothetical protein AciPR4_3822 [Terriglobus saanensis SP1PR4]
MALSSNTPGGPEATIHDIEQIVQNGLEALRNAPLNEQITSALKFLTPAGYRPIAQFEEDGRKKRSSAAASNWNPETGEIVIYFEKQQELKVGLVKNPGELTSAERHADTSSSIKIAADEREVSEIDLQQICLALADAEKAGKSFIAFKWFRDNDLTEREYPWVEPLERRQAVLNKAVEVGAIFTSSIPNPKAPQHPTTTVKLNRESKFAQAVAPRFQPIRARGGESASEILLRDRGRL